MAPVTLSPRRRKRGRKTKEELASLRNAFVKLVAKKPWLVSEAFERGLLSSRPLGYLELGARLLKEVGQTSDQAPKVAIVFNSNGLNAQALRPLPGASSPAPALSARAPLGVLDVSVEALEALGENPSSASPREPLADSEPTDGDSELLDDAELLEDIPSNP